MGWPWGQQGGATACGWCVLEERRDPAGTEGCWAFLEVLFSGSLFMEQESSLCLLGIAPFVEERILIPW